MTKEEMKIKFVDNMMDLHKRILFKGKYKIAKKALEDLNIKLDIEDTERENKAQDKRLLITDVKEYLKALVTDILDKYPVNYTGTDSKKLWYKQTVDEAFNSLQKVVGMSFWQELKEYCGLT